MLTHDRIVEAVSKAANQFPISKAEYFGSYADGNATEESDLDLLVDFGEKTVSILTVIGLKQYFEEELNKSVDVISVPLPKEAIIVIGKTVNVL